MLLLFHGGFIISSSDNLYIGLANCFFRYCNYCSAPFACKKLQTENTSEPPPKPTNNLPNKGCVPR